MIYEFLCKCGFKNEVYYSTIDKYKVPVCTCCGELMNRVYSPCAIRIDASKTKAQKSAIELGNEYPKAAQQQDRLKNVEKELLQVINSNSDWELSKLNE